MLEDDAVVIMIKSFDPDEDLANADFYVQNNNDKNTPDTNNTNNNNNNNNNDNNNNPLNPNTNSSTSTNGGSNSTTGGLKMDIQIPPVPPKTVRMDCNFGG